MSNLGSPRRKNNGICTSVLLGLPSHRGSAFLTFIYWLGSPIILIDSKTPVHACYAMLSCLVCFQSYFTFIFPDNHTLAKKSVEVTY